MFIVKDDFLKLQNHPQVWNILINQVDQKKKLVDEKISKSNSMKNLVEQN